jgi:hypothetical protein
MFRTGDCLDIVFGIFSAFSRHSLWQSAYCSAQADGLTPLSHGNIVRLHAVARQGTIARKSSLLLGSPDITGLPQPLCKK